MKLSDDKTRVHLSINKSDLDAVGVSRLIIELAELRAQMVPEVPAVLPTASTEAMLAHEHPSLHIGHTGDGRICLSLRSEGLGWSAYQFDVAQSAALRDYLVAHAPAATVGSKVGGSTVH